MLSDSKMTGHSEDSISRLLYLVSLLAELPGSKRRNNNGSVFANNPLISNKDQVGEFEEKVYSLISENSGKLVFADLLSILGGAQYKKLLYHILSKLTRQGKITRIRGIGKKRIEFYYHDTTKIRKIPQYTSAILRSTTPYRLTEWSDKVACSSRKWTMH